MLCSAAQTDDVYLDKPDNLYQQSLTMLKVRQQNNPRTSVFHQSLRNILTQC